MRVAAQHLHTAMAPHAPLTLALLLSPLCLFAVLGDEGMGRGLGDDYDWQTLDAGLALARESGKPVMLVIHKSWCGACKAFKPKFASSKAIHSLSNKFVMVNVMDDEEPSDAKYVPDGGYIPRVLFLDSKGNVQKDIINESGNPKYKYYYFDDVTVVDSMKKALKVITPGKEL